MKKSKKSLISAVTALSTVATVMAPATTALADTTNGWAVNGQSWNYYTNGAMVKNAWVQDAGTWYYMGAEGTMATGWVNAGGTWYFMGANGAMVTNTWTQDSAKNYFYMGANGAMVANGWAQDGTSKKWYFMAANGVMEANKWIVTGGFNYYMGATGSMLTDTTTPDGYKVLANGTWDGKDKEVAVPEKLEIKSVTSINAAQIKVTFNKDLTETDLEEAEDLDNYTLNDADGDEIDDVLDTVDAEEGSDTAILTVKYSAVDSEDYKNQTSYELVIGEDVVGKEVTKTFKVSDFEIPEVVSAEVAGIRTVKVILSEPIVGKDYADNTSLVLEDTFEDSFEINDGDYSIQKVEVINNGKELNVVLFSDIEDGEELTVDVKSKSEDFAGYSLKKATLKIKADFDTSALAIASYKKAEDNEITLVFNKDVKFSDDTDATQLAVSATGDYLGWDVMDADTAKDLYHSSSKNTVEAAEIDGNELTLYFANGDELPETAYVYVDADVLEDLWEEKNNDLFIKVNATKDQTRPVVESIEQDEDAQDKIIIKFSEDLDSEEAEKESNYTVTDENGNNVRVSDATLDGDEVTLELSKDLDAGDKYEVLIEDVEDKADNKISDTTKSFTAIETQNVVASDLTLRYYNQSDSDQKIVIDFDTKMLADGSRYAIDNLDNYDLTVNGTVINLADYDGVSVKTVDNDNKVEIKLPGNDPDGDDAFDFTGATLTMTISKLEDVSGNRTDLFEDLIVEALNSSLGLDDDTETPAAIDTETIKVVLSDEFDFDKDDVSIGYYAGTTDTTPGADADWNKITPSTTKVSKADGVTTITYTLNDGDQLKFNGKYNTDDTMFVRTVAASDIKSENSYGDKLIGDAKWAVMDETTPELAIFDSEADSEADSLLTSYSTTKVFLDDRKDYEDAVRVTKFDGTTAEITLTFEEKLTENIDGNAFIFKTDDSDVDVTAAELTDNVITLTLNVDNSDYTTAEKLLGLGISTGSNEVYDLATSSMDGVNGTVINTEIEAVDATDVATFATATTDLVTYEALPLTTHEEIVAAVAAKAGVTRTNAATVTTTVGSDEVKAALVVRLNAVDAAIDAAVDAELLAATDAEALLDSDDYVDYSAVTTALALTEADNAEKITKTDAILAAIEGLALK